MVEYIRLEKYGHFRNGIRAEFTCRRDKKGGIVEYVIHRAADGTEVDDNVGSTRVSAEWMRQWEALGIDTWEERYEPIPGTRIIDGELWTILYKTGDGGEGVSSGNTAYPQEWDDLGLLLDEAVPAARIISPSLVEVFEIEYEGMIYPYDEEDDVLIPLPEGSVAESIIVRRSEGTVQHERRFSNGYLSTQLLQVPEVAYAILDAVEDNIAGFREGPAKSKHLRAPYVDVTVVTHRNGTERFVRNYNPTEIPAEWAEIMGIIHVGLVSFGRPGDVFDVGVFGDGADVYDEYDDESPVPPEKKYRH